MSESFRILIHGHPVHSHIYTNILRLAPIIRLGSTFFFQILRLWQKVRVIKNGNITSRMNLLK